jgi:hypothetical protein
MGGSAVNMINVQDPACKAQRAKTPISAQLPDYIKAQVKIFKPCRRKFCHPPQTGFPAWFTHADSI